MCIRDRAWQADIDQVLSMAEEFSAYQGRLTESAAALSAAFQEKDAPFRLFSLPFEKCFNGLFMKEIMRSHYRNELSLSNLKRNIVNRFGKT